MERKYSFYKKIAICLVFVLMFQISFPTISLALTSGPSQPEFSSFEPVATTNMVNDFTGDLAYNLPVLEIPGPDGGGYAMSLSYHSGASPEEEASWVGYGWTLNPGAINRLKRGFPDDWKQVNVNYLNTTPTNRTVTVGGSVNLEAISYDPSFNAGASLRYNNYKGFGYSANVGISFGNGIVSLGYNISDGEGSFSLGVSPAKLFDSHTDKSQRAVKSDVRKMKRNGANNKSIQEKYKNIRNTVGKKYLNTGVGNLQLLGSNYGIASFAGADRSTQVTQFSGDAYTITGSVLGTPSPLQVGVAGNLHATYAYQNTEDQNLKAYGYMYSSEIASNTDVMDYYMEKQSTYDKRDAFLGIPFNNSDNFNVTGEGIGGSFRVYNRTVGHFRPNYTSSKANHYNIGAEFEAGLNFGGGADVGTGSQVLEVREWVPDNVSSFSSISDDEGVFFRFNGDKGGVVSYGSEKEQKANIVNKSNIRGFKVYDPDISAITTELNDGERSKRSSYIGFNTNKNLSSSNIQGGVYYKSYEKNPDIHTLLNRGETGNGYEDLIGEFSVTNEDGANYNYGLPVFNRNESNLQIGLEGANVVNSYLAYKSSSDSETKIGETTQAPYASTYLLTSITSKDYIDIDYNGPSQADFGGWTKFSYKRAWGSNSKNGSGDWYKWRIPYNGLSYNRNELSTSKDDMGSVISGEKEIYYLDNVTTKTHKAIFYTSDRYDGFDAASDEATASSISTAKGTHQLQKLDKIELYTYNENSTQELLKTVHFEYSYEVWPGIPNTNGSESNTGKLTLKKVWFEYNGKVNGKIAPYQFEYKYPTSVYPKRYAHLQNYGTTLNENAAFDRLSLDAWGNYQMNGDDRHDSLKSGLDQSGRYEDVFDPAVWQLKVIKLPSGGEIHIQYEQDDYSYVQDQVAHVMVSLKNDHSVDDNSSSRYYLNVSDIGIDESNSGEMSRLMGLIRRIYQNEKIYFKFLYKLLGNGDAPSLTHCNAEYIDGYVSVNKVGLDANGIYLQLGSGSKYTLPKEVCQDFVRTQRAGQLRENGDCNPDDQGIFNSNDPASIGKGFVRFLGVQFIPDNTCRSVNFGLSYLRIPVPGSKKGGGIRVKRLLMFDEGIETGYPALYGSEYVYRIYDNNIGLEVSSGVATNEPGSIREENVLVGFLPRGQKTTAGKIISGRDKKQSEGPLGESIMPSPTVGYSKVIVKNIHSGKTNPGFTIKDFYTAKEYPFKGPNLKGGGDNITTLSDNIKDYLPVPGGLINKLTNNVWMSQGFLFELNNMHGQLRKEATYSGSYADIMNPSGSTLVASVENLYYDPKEEVPVIMDINDTYPYQKKALGREMDLAMESKVVSDIGDDQNIEGDVDAGVFGIIVLPFMSFTPSLSWSKQELYTHTTTKVIQYPVIAKGTITYRDGVYHVTKNEAFDPNTGQPLVTKTYDGFHKEDLLASMDHDGTYTSYSIPASRHYRAFNQKAEREGKTVSFGTGVTVKRVVNGSNTFLEFSASAGNTVCDAMRLIEEGDLIQLPISSGELYHVGKASGNNLQIYKTSFASIGSGSTTISALKIIRSGRNNRLSEAIGGITTYGEKNTIDIPLSNVSNPGYYSYNQRVDLAEALNTSTTSVPLTWSAVSEGPKYDLCMNLSGTEQARVVEQNGVKKLQIFKPAIIETLSNTKVFQSTNYSVQTTFPGYLRSSGECFWVLNNPYNVVTKYNLSSSPVYSHPSNNNSTYLMGRLFVTFNTFNLPTDATVTSAKVRIRITGNQWSEQFTFSPLGIINPFAMDKCNSGITYPGPPIEMSNIFWTKAACKDAYAPYYHILGGHGGVLEGELDILPQYIQRSPSPRFQHNVVFSMRSYPDAKYATQYYDYLRGTGVYTNGRYAPILTVNYNYPHLIQAEQILCEQSFPINGSFVVDENSGAFTYLDDTNPCNPIEVNCFNFCGNLGSKTTWTNVVACNAATFASDWDYDLIKYRSNGFHQSTTSWNTYSNYNEYELGKKGKWKKQSDFVFKENLSSGQNYLAGKYNMELFNWDYFSLNSSKWLEINKVTQYSPNGNALEEQNILGVKSTAKFGYRKSAPYLIAQNASNSSVSFESFENRYSGTQGSYFEDGVSYGSSYIIDNTISHSGNNSVRLRGYSQGFKLFKEGDFTYTDQIINNGMLVKVWAKMESRSYEMTGEELEVRENNGTRHPFVSVARVGDWNLLECKIPTISSFGNLEVRSTSNYSNHYIWIDDVRSSPMDAQMTAYVYDPISMRLMATFDDQNFALFYQYNDEGKLVRRLIETERGIKTVQETQYNTPLTVERPH